jgi:hypothetical protein
MTIHRSIATLVVAVAVSVATLSVAAVGFAQGDAAASLRTASYPLFAVDGSGVTGHLQIVETAGGSQLVLTVQGLVEGGAHSAAIYAGDCGPDRPVVLELEPIGRENDPFVSITESTITFDELTEGDHFVYVFDGATIDRPDAEGLDVPALACGEVGAGALEGQP